MRRTKDGCNPVPVAGGGLRVEGAAEFFFNVVVEREHAQAAIVGEQRTNQRAAQRLAGGLDQQHGMLVDGGSIEQRFEDGREVANRNLLAQKLLQDFLHFAEAENFGNQFLDQLGMALAQAIEQALGFLAGQQFVGMLADDFGQVGGEHGSLIDDGIAGSQRLRLERARNPERGDAESGLAGGSSGQRRAA